MPPSKKLPSKNPSAPQPPRPALPDTLSQRVQHLRDVLDLTPRKLAEKALVPQQLVEDIESGLETFLAPAVRQKLARALRVRPSLLEEVEKRPAAPEVLVSEESIEMLVEAALKDPQRAYYCPQCGGKLVVRLFERRDLHDMPLTAVKIHCSKCLFRLDFD